MTFRSSLTIGALTLATLALAAFDGFSIKPKFKEGDVHKYRTLIKLDFNGTPFEVSELQTLKVVKVDPDGGWTIKEDASEVKFNGDDAPEGSTSTGSVIAHSAKGEVLSISGDDTGADAYRFENLNVFAFPDTDVKVGDSWTYDLKPDTKKGSVAGKATYTVIGEEKIGTIDTVKIKYSVKESGAAADTASCDGTYWVSKADGSLVKATTKWLNVPVPKAPMPISGDVTMTLIP